MAGGRNAFRRELDVIKWPVLVPRRVLNRATHKPGISGHLDRLGHRIRIIAKAILEIR